MDFSTIIPVWKNEGAEPNENLKENGFTAGYKPPAPYFNYLFHNLRESIAENRTNLKQLDSDLVAITNGEIDSIVK